MEKIHSPPEKFAKKKKKSLALPEHAALICPEGKQQALKRG